MNKSPRTLKAIMINKERVMTANPSFSQTNLCDSCAFSEPFEQFAECWVDRRVDESLRKMGVGRMVNYCVMYQPIIAFKKPLVGFDHLFNTFRPGGAWSVRLKPNMVIGLFDADKEALFGKARVVAVEFGSLLTMIEKHGSENHLVKNDPTVDLRKVLGRLYGPRIVNDKSSVTVISLERLSCG